MASDPDLQQWADDGGPAPCWEDHPIVVAPDEPCLVDMRAAAKAYLDAGYLIVPLEPGSKEIHDPGWPKRIYGLADVQANGNLGLKCVRHAVVDLDCKLALACADEFLPETPRIEGRTGKPRSHRSFVAELPSEPFRDIDKTYSPQTMLVEIKHGQGHQVVVPPSLHESGERRSWADGSVVGPLAAKVDAALLHARVRAIATVALIARHWPPDGRHDLRLAYARVLLGTLKLDVPTAERILTWACRLGGSDDSGIRDAVSAIQTTKAALDRDDPTTGIPTVTKLLPEGDKIVARLKDFYDVGTVEVTVRKASDVPDEKLEKLFGGRLLRGSFPLVAGPGEAGKGMLLVRLAAYLTTGDPFPDELDRRVPRNVMICATEDSQGVMKSRLRAAGADLDRVYFVTGPLVTRGGLVMPSPMRLDDDAGSLVREAKKLDAIALMLETTVEHFGDREGKTFRRSTHTDADVRQALGPFREICQQAHLFGLGLIHPRKSSDGGIEDSISGSAAFRNVPRGISHVYRDPADENRNPRRLLMSGKANYLAIRPPTLRFHIVSWDEERGVACLCGHSNCGHEGRLVWDEDIEDERTAEQVWREMAERGKPRRDTSVQEAEEFLTGLMRNDRIDHTPEEIFKLAKDEGIARMAVRRARKKLRLVTIYDGFPAEAVGWKLPKS